CCASYIDAFTRSSCRNSGGGVGRLLPFDPNAVPDVCVSPPIALACPMLNWYRCELALLEVFPLKMLLESTPFTWNVLEVSRCPFAQIGWLPRPAFVSTELSNSAFTPGD